MTYKLLALIPAGLAVAAPAAAPSAAVAIGLWRNPKQTIEVRTGMCGAELCGTVVAASSTARADARDAGVTHLIGTALLRNYRQTGPDSWSGRVFVPDMGRVFASRIAVLPPNRLRISGCILGGLVCKSQVWTRA